MDSSSSVPYVGANIARCRTIWRPETAATLQGDEEAAEQVRARFTDVLEWRQVCSATSYPSAELASAQFPSSAGATAADLEVPALVADSLIRSGRGTAGRTASNAALSALKPHRR